MKRKILLLVSILISILSCGWAKSPDSKEFVVGTTSGYAPFVSLNARGEYEGFDIDFANLLANHLGRKLVLRDLGSMPSLLMALKQKKIDAVIWAVSITEERSKEMNMIHYQGEVEAEMPMFFVKEMDDNIVTLEDLFKKAKKPICVEAGTSQESILRTFSTANLKNVDKIADAIMEVKYGKSTAAAVDSSLVANISLRNPELQIKYFPLPQQLQSFGNGIAIAKTNTQLADEVRIKVNTMKESGAIAKLEEKWGLGKKTQ